MHLMNIHTQYTQYTHTIYTTDTHNIPPISNNPHLTHTQIYLWCTIYKDSWSAFAPDFQELEENTEYVEPEDEFDVNGKQEDPRAAAAAGQDHAVCVCVCVVGMCLFVWGVLCSCCCDAVTII